MGPDCCCLILAAGKGTRLLPLTRFVPKPLFPLLDIPALEHLVKKIKNSGICQIAINCHHLTREIEKWQKNCQVAHSTTLLYEEVLLDTGGAIKNFFETFGFSHPLLVYNSDIVSNVSISKFYEIFLRRGCDALLCLHDMDRFNKVKLNGPKIQSLSASGKDCLAYTGISIFRPGCFMNAPDGPFPLVPYVEMLIKNGLSIEGCLAEEVVEGGSDNDWSWYDIGTPAEYLKANFHLLERIGKKSLINSAEVDGEVEIESNAIIGTGARIRGRGIIENVVIWPGTEMTIDGTLKNAIITPFARISCTENR